MKAVLVGPAKTQSATNQPTAGPARAKDKAACEPAGTGEHRRGFFGKFAAIMIGAIITVFPFAAGLLVFADPLRRGSLTRGFLKITTLDSVPDDGVPRLFQVVASRVDAWTYFPSEPIGAVFIRRQKGQAKPEVLQSTCPHAGCMVDLAADQREFQCPCHNSSFKLDGEINGSSPAPRPMDSLACEVRDNHGLKEVWVKFENFYTGIAEKIVKG